MLGYLYEEKKVYKDDYKRAAMAYYGKACILNDKDSCEKIKNKTKKLKNKKKEIKKILDVKKENLKNTKKDLQVKKEKTPKQLYIIAKGHQDKKDYKKANPVFTKACEKGNLTSCDFVAWNYENGFGFTKSVSTAIIYYKKACTKKSAYSCNKVAYFYDNGKNFS